MAQKIQLTPLALPGAVRTFIAKASSEVNEVFLLPIALESHSSLIGSEIQHSPFTSRSGSDLGLEGASGFGARLIGATASHGSMDMET